MPLLAPKKANLTQTNGKSFVEKVENLRASIRNPNPLDDLHNPLSKTDMVMITPYSKLEREKLLTGLAIPKIDIVIRNTHITSLPELGSYINEQYNNFCLAMRELVVADITANVSKGKYLLKDINTVVKEKLDEVMKRVKVPNTCLDAESTYKKTKSWW